MTPARMNVWGEDIVLPGGVFRQWLPYKWSEETADPVELEFERLGIYPGLPGRNVTIDKKKVELPESIYRDYSISYGQKAKIKMEELISATWLQGRSDEFKEKLYNKQLEVIKHRERERAKLEYKKQEGLR
ncbi:MAG TPA: hypothetical protein ENH82_13470 [bacterium]|nr:hypothetical protein [bacterium]